MADMVKLPGTRVLMSERPEARVRRLRVSVRKGPDKGLSKDLDVEPVRIGTSEGCDVRLSDAAVSGVHVELQRSPYGVLVRDLGSTNGTFLDGRRIQGVHVDSPAVLAIGESELKITPLGEETPLELLADDRFGDMVGMSVPMRALFAKLQKVAASDSTVTITGETGTGKELVAAAIRDHSPRRDGPFVVVDCGALPANLIESELFGHERGAFTGAERARAGAFERAHRGTIFLDEIGELPLNLQPALLGVLERREGRRVGGEQTISLDVRVICATNRDLAAEVSRGAFRADLYYRLAVVELRLPPLRDRREDIPLLIEHFLAQLEGERPTLSPETIAHLQTYPWPGNVRELKNVIERAALLAEEPRPTGAPSAAPRAASSGVVDIDVERPFKDLKNELIADFERVYVQRLVEKTGGNIAAAARKARIDRMYLYKLLERYSIEVPARGK